MAKSLKEKSKSFVVPPPRQKVLHNISLLTSHDIYLFKEGNHFQLYDKLGAHPISRNGLQGTYFAVWAPNAKKVSVIGNFNGWNRDSHPLGARWDSSGIWEGFIPELHTGELYKYHIVSRENDYQMEKIDPFAFSTETPPKTACTIWDLSYEWHDQEWLNTRHKKNSFDAPMAIYEVHLGSWRRVIEENNRSLTYRELANYLVDYVKRMGYTHVELLPIMEHPFYGSWGYQTLGYFSATNRYGTPQDLMHLIDCFHQQDIGVLLDWVPSHFPSDDHGLAYFDGTNLYEHSGEDKKIHPDWNSYIFNHGRNEVKEFLISSALFWLDKYHIDGLRVDAVASMLYLDYSRENGKWTPNIYGGRENLDSLAFIKRLNETVYSYFPDVQMVAEESTAWPAVSRPTYDGGLGFGMKWNMGWMHDTLKYLQKDPVYRKHHHNELTFSFLYVFTENFVLSLSHDEVVHGKGTLLSKMPCDDWQKFANLRLLYGYMYGHPGKKLLFMGGEFGQWSEWHHEQSLDWHLLQFERHQGLQKLVIDLNYFYRQEKAMHVGDFRSDCFEWIDGSDTEQGVLSFLRKDPASGEMILVVCHFTPTPLYDYRIGVPSAGFWKECFNTDAKEYWGSGNGNMGGVHAEAIGAHGRSHSLKITIPPLGVLFFKKQ